MPTKDLRNVIDTYVSAVSAKEKAKNFRAAARIYVQGDNANGASSPFRSFMTWSNPVPLRSRVLSYKLGLYVGEAWGTGNVIYVQAVNKAWSDSKVNWNNMPGVTGPQVSYTIPSTKPKNGYVEIDISAIMQAVANGTVQWRGVRIIATGTRKSFHAAQAKATLRPIIKANWSSDPAPPTSLVPRGGAAISTQLPLLDFVYSDLTNGDRDQVALQIQLSTNAAFTSLAFDTGEYPTSLSQYQLTDTPVPPNEMFWWRVRVKDETGRWTGYSNAESFYYSPPPQVSIVNPTTSGVVEDNTPLISWSLPVAQGQYRLQMFKEADGYSAPIYDTGLITSGETDLTLPQGIVTNYEDNYRVVVYSSDTLNRIAVPGADRFTVAERYFKFAAGAGVSPVTNLQLTPNAIGLPYERLSWERDQIPDAFAVVQNGKYLYEGDPTIFQDESNPTKYGALVVSPGRTVNSYQVVAKVNGVAGAGAPTVTKEVKRSNSWVIGRDRNYPAKFHNASWDLAYREINSVVDTLNGPPTLMLQTMQGRTGTFSGEIIDRDLPEPYSAKAMKADMELLRRDRGGKSHLIFADEVMDIYFYDLKLSPMPRADGGTDYMCSFSFIEATE